MRRFAVAIALLAGCQVPVPIEGRHVGAVFPTARIDLSLGAEVGCLPDEGTILPADIATGIEVSVTGASGEFAIDDAFVDDAEYRMVAASILGEIRIEGESFDFAVALGSGVDRVDFEFGGAQPFTHDDGHFALVMGVEGAFRPTEDVRLFARIEPWLDLPEASSLFFDLGVSWDVAAAARVVTAYRLWAYSEDAVSSPSGTRDLDLEAHGILLGMEVRL